MLDDATHLSAPAAACRTISSSSSRRGPAMRTRRPYRQGWKKPGFKKTTQWVFVFLGFFILFFYIFAQKREFLGFFQF
jgi:hypothetical protein